MSIFTAKTTINEAEPKELPIGGKVFYKRREYTVVVKNPQGYYMIKNRRGEIHWVKPHHVMVLHAPLV